MGRSLSEQNVLLTGGSGFLGGHIVDALARRGAREILAPPSAELDLRDATAVRRYLAEHRPSLVIHAAGVVGGIGANREHPGRFFHENLLMGLNAIEESRLAGVAKFVCLGTICAYPKFAPVPFREDDLWNGYPEETNAPYGIAKKALLVQLQAYREEYGFNGVYLLPVNLYGPRDHFDLESGHVIPAMIEKFLAARDAGAASVELWGDGSPTREFLYVEDAAGAIVTAAEIYDRPEPLNLGTGEEIRIFDLALLIAHLTGFEGEIRWDTSKPNGQPRRRLDTTRAREALGFTARTSLAEGLRRTVDWYLTQRR